MCRTCCSKLEEIQHTRTGCATCEEVVNFKLDLRACCDRACSGADDATLADIRARAGAVCTSIDEYHGHMTRVRNQVTCYGRLGWGVEG